MDKEKQEVVVPKGVAKGAFRDNAEVVCFALLLIMFFKTFVGQQFTIPTSSMRNTLMIGDHLLANKFIFARPQWGWESALFPMRPVSRGDIIVFRYPNNRDADYVKRCVALPGDTVEMRDKRLYVNGRMVTGTFEHHRLPSERGWDTLAGPWPLSRNAGPLEVLSPDAPKFWPYAWPDVIAADQQGMTPLESGGFRDFLGPITVPEGFVFAMGDNRDNSLDSRYWGFLPMDHLRGRPFMVWWSYRENGNDEDAAKVPEGPMDVARNFGDAARYFFVRTRWERMGTIPR